MKNLVANCVRTFLLTLCILPSLQAQNHLNFHDSRRIVLERTEVIPMHSVYVEEDYEILISLPPGYQKNDSHYPVVIGLDAYTGYLIVKGCVDAFTSLYPLIPDVILVGIGYGGREQEALARWIAGRTRDFTPVRNEGTEKYYEAFLRDHGCGPREVTTGGAGQFLSFLEKELLPYLGDHYRIEPDNKVFYGASFGGLFAIYTLFHSPGLFNKFCIESPSLHYKGGISFTYESQYAADHTDLDAKIFLCAGSLETGLLEPLYRFDSLLLSRNYPSLVLEKYIFEGENHLSCAPAAISRGLIEIFNNKK